MLAISSMSKKNELGICSFAYNPLALEVPPLIKYDASRIFIFGLS